MTYAKSEPARARQWRLLVLVAAALILAAGLAACGEDKPPVCTSVQDLQESVDGVKAIDVTSADSLSELETGLSSVQDNLTTVKSDAQTQFSTQISSVESSYATLTKSVDAAKANPTPTTLAPVGSALSQFGSDVDSLVTEVNSTC